MTNSVNIPNYSRYGESAEIDSLGPLHCETIISSLAVHNWHVKPHRHGDLLQFMFVEKGGMEANVDGVRYDLKTSSIVYIAPMTVHSFRFNASSTGCVFSLRMQSLSDHLQNLMAMIPHGLTHLVYCSEDSPTTMRLLAPLFSNILQEYHSKNIAQQHIIEACLLLIFSHINRDVEKFQTQPKPIMSNYEKLAESFKILVEKNYTKHRSMSFYASELNISIAKLSNVCNSVFGKSPKAICHSRLIVEAQRSLYYTGFSMAQISDHLGFKDPAYFSRFFKSRTGKTPAKFRQKHNFG